VTERQPYTLASGEVVPSVTEVLAILDKPGLVAWAGRLGRGWEQVRDSAAQAGTLAHAAIEAHLTGGEVDSAEYSDAEKEGARASFRTFRKWQAEHEFGEFTTEKRLGSETYHYAGTFDWYGEIDGRFEIIDFKTSGAVYESHLIQVAAYRWLLEESGNRVDAVRVLCLPRTGAPYVDKVVEDTNDRLSIFTHALAIYQIQQRLKEGTP